jgi:glutathione peroxidase
MSTSISDLQVNTMSGTVKALSDYQGKALLIVNVASYCGYTSQYKGLEALQQTYQAQGFEVLGFPCNDFGSQEPGTNEQIQQFCATNYGTSFTLFDKVHAIGANQHPLYQRLSQAVEPIGPVSWNFEKFLVSRQGEVMGRFKSGITPESKELISAIEAALG